MNTRCTLLIGALAAALPARSRAQDQTVIFQHGISSTGTTWGNTPNLLRYQLKIAPWLSTVPHCETYPTQAAVLAQSVATGLPGQANLITVGHSNGGIVAREFNRQTGKSNRIVTVDSPHGGAPLARNLLTGNIRNLGLYVQTLISSVFGYYLFYDDGLGIPGAALDTFGPAMFWTASNIEPLSIAFGLGLSPIAHVFCPVLYEMVPGSRYLTDTLNSTANLQREATAFSKRVGLVSDASPYNAFFYLVDNFGFPGQAILNARWGLYVTSILAYFHYARSPSPILASRADHWLAIATAMLDWDAWWANLNGSLAPGGYQRAQPAPFIASYSLNAPGDGVLPLYAQHYPQGNREYALAGMLHLDQTQHYNTVTTLATTMLNDLNVAARPQGSVASVDVTPSSMTVATGKSASLTAVTKDVFGILVPNQPITWTSTSPTVASVNSTGSVMGLSAGSTKVIAASGGYSDTSLVFVVNGAPLSSVGIGGPSSIGAGLEAQFTALPIGGTPPLQYKWSVNGVQRQLGASSSFTWASTQSYTLSLIATDALGTQKTATRSVSVVSCSNGNC